MKHHIAPLTKPLTTPEPFLVWAGSSSVGLYAIQIATLAGYQVVTTCSPKNFELVKSLGAVAAYDYSDVSIHFFNFPFLISNFANSILFRPLLQQRSRLLIQLFQWLLMVLLRREPLLWQLIHSEQKVERSSLSYQSLLSYKVDDQRLRYNLPWLTRLSEKLSLSLVGSLQISRERS